MIIETTIDRYVTGMAALSVPDERGRLADWHFFEAFSGKKELRINGLNHLDSVPLFGHDGIADRSQYLIDKGIVDAGPVFMASHARAVADMLFHVISCGNSPDFIDLVGYALADDVLDELRDYVKKLNILFGRSEAYKEIQLLSDWRRRVGLI